MALMLYGAGVRPALAGCSPTTVTTGSVVTCDATSTQTTMVGDPMQNNVTVNVGSGAQIQTNDSPTISLGDGNTINVGPGASLTNTSDADATNGPAGTGNNTVEFGSNTKMVIGKGAQVITNGIQGDDEAINPRGTGNVIINHGLIEGNVSTAIWFENAGDMSGADNVVINAADGVISSINDAVGGNGTKGIVVINKGLIDSNLDFYGEDNTLRLFTGSSITGSLNGGTGGTNQLFLQGTGTGAAAGQLPNEVDGFQTIEKDDAGTWTVSGAIDNTPALTVTNGTLILTNNDPLSGTTITGGTLQLGDGSTNGTITGNVANSGTLAFDNPDSSSFGGVISGTGVVQQNGAGTTVLMGLNTYTGATQINAGTLRTGVANALSTATAVTVADGATFDLASNDQSIGSLAGAGNTTLGSASLSTGNDNTDTTYSGVMSGTGSMTKAGSGTFTLTGANTYTGGTTIAGGTLQLGDGGTTGSILGDVADNGTLAFDRSDVVTFPGIISGTGGVQQNGSGTTILSAASTYTGPTVINAGTLAVDGSITSATTVTQAGTLAGSGTVIGNVLNAGDITPGAPGGPLAAGTLTVRGNYVGQNGTLTLNTVLGSDNSPTDKLVIDGANGGAQATGTTGITIHNAGGAGAQTNANGIMVVQAVNNATTAASAFSLNGSVRAGAYDYRLFQGGLAPSDTADSQDWFLRSTFVAPPPANNSGGGVNGGSGAGDPATLPIFGPELSVYASVAPTASLLGLTTLGTLHERVGEEQNIIDSPNGSKTFNGGWGRVIGETYRDKYSSVTDPTTHGTIVGLQTGVDIYRGDNQKFGGRDHAGVYFAYDHANTGVDGLVTNPAATGYIDENTGNINLDAYSGGAYFTHFGPSGWYLDAVAQGTSYSGNASTDRTAASVSGYGLAASLEVGYPIHLTSQWLVEPEAQIISQYVHMNSTADAFSSVDMGNSSSITGRVGARAQYTVEAGKWLLQPYFHFNLWSTLAGASSNTTYGGIDTITTNAGATWGQVGGGLTAKVTKMVSVYAYLDYLQGMGNDRHRGADGGLGVRVNW